MRTTFESLEIDPDAAWRLDGEFGLFTEMSFEKKLKWLNNHKEVAKKFWMPNLTAILEAA